MDVLVGTIHSIWIEMGLYTIPIININFQQFFVALLVVTVVIRSINIILGRHEDSGGKE